MLCEQVFSVLAAAHEAPGSAQHGQHADDAAAVQLAFERHVIDVLGHI